MNGKPPLPVRPVRVTQPPAPTNHFTMRFSSTPRGARLVRCLAGERLDAWGIAYGSEPHDALTLIVAELCANAVCHGRVPGRDFRLGLTVAQAPDGASVAVEVTDTRGEKLPEPSPAPAGSPDPPDDADGGRGLLLVAALADDWGWYPRFDGPGKTVWATLHAVSR
ncbi:ATP-binding protein [Streptomyces sp. S4.7]|uniref:ATP-binding protein n=1 Tax=Streptomyces sp. S4.7 TaxID=2705439 RepID=UPI0013DBD324|nr:ATP-binding protein [Streptomyces sp. S4.7]